MRRMLITWALFGGLAIWILSYETLQFKSLQQFKMVDNLQYSVNSLSTSIYNAVGAFSVGNNSTSIIEGGKRSSANNKGSSVEGTLHFPPNINYTTFLALHPDTRNTTAQKINGTSESPLLSYFPDFCEDW